MTLLTQEEVARMLRRSVRAIARLRATGELPFLPGRPVLMRQVDIENYIEGKMTGLEKPKARMLSSIAQRSTKFDGLSQASKDLEAARRAHAIFRSLKKS